jgi:hypothetical protein
MESVLPGVIGELDFIVQGTGIELMIDALNACMTSAGIVICTFMIPFTHVQGAPNRWLGMRGSTVE